MKLHKFSTIAISVIALTCAHSAIGAEIDTSGTACWTGTSNALGTSAKDWGMTWELTGTYVDDASEESNSYYRCVGLGGMINGEPQVTKFWCLNHYPDGATALRTGESPAGERTSTGQYVSGTGSHEGVSGDIVGEAFKSIGKAPQGKFAGCRQVKAKKILK